MVATVFRVEAVERPNIIIIILLIIGEIFSHNTSIHNEMNITMNAAFVLHTANCSFFLIFPLNEFAWPRRLFMVYLLDLCKNS